MSLGKLFRMLFSSGVVLAVTLSLPLCAVGDHLATLKDHNSTVKVDLSGGLGAYDWIVEGTDHLQMQWFWYRVEGSGPERPLEDLTLLGYQVLDTDGFLGEDPGLDMLVAGYQTSVGSSTPFRIIIKYMLTGGATGSGTSDIAEVIKIQNLSDTDPLDFHFFQYTNLDLDGTPDDDSVAISGGNTARQISGTTTVSETVVTPMPSRCEAALYSSTFDKLDDDSVVASTLNNNAAAGLGDVTWAFQWDVEEIPAGGSYIISKNKHISGVPEPSSLALLGVAMLIAAGWAYRRRRRRR